MRQIGHLEDENAARMFGDFLYVRGIENQVELEAGTGWVIWILSDDNLDRARQLLTEYQANPQHPSFKAQAAGAAEAREQAKKDQEAYAARVKASKQAFAPLYGYGFGPVTIVLMLACVGVAIWSRLGEDTDKIMGLFITRYSISGAYITWVAGLPEIRHGEVWRLVTPIFIHFGFPHIAFNLLAFRDLGSTLESRHGSWFFILQVVVIAIVSNLTQFFIGGAPSFGGMSGVVYGLLGYIWLRGKYDPGFGMALHPTTVIMAIVWFGLCWSGVLGSVANWAHTGGLIVGGLWGYLAALKNR